MFKITGGNDSMIQKSIEFKRLSLDREFAETRLATALSSLEQARTEVQRQQLYLERIVMPHKPDFPLLPHRIWNIVTTLIISFMLYGVLKLLLAGIKEHNDQ
jgi:capsular polysaccharide transport system permease protein